VPGDPQSAHRSHLANHGDTVRLPPAAEFGPNHQQSLASAGHKFGVAAPFPDRRGRNRSAIHLTGLVRAIVRWLLIKNILKVITTVTPKVRAIYLWKSRHGRVTAGSQ
jgi:hypothetical protein